MIRKKKFLGPSGESLQAKQSLMCLNPCEAIESKRRGLIIGVHNVNLH